jgi:hypothetical protein
VALAMPLPKQEIVVVSGIGYVLEERGWYVGMVLTLDPGRRISTHPQ